MDTPKDTPKGAHTAPPGTVPKPAGLRLHALDAEDLAVLSAHMQDSLARVGDIAYLPAKRRFALAAARFDWEAETDGRRERVRSGLHFEGVTRVRQRGVARERPEEILSLLAIAFEAGETPPAGVVRLVFSGGASILLDVECVEAQMRDLGPRWPVSCCPCHDLDENADGGP
jgi:hypothetical protein